MKYQILEGITTADIAYRIYGISIPDLFVNAAIAVEQTMVDIASVERLQSSRFKSQSSKLENLLLDYLNQLLYLKDAKQLIFSQFEVKLQQLETGSYILTANCLGEKINPQKHKLRTDVKAVTYHHLQIKKMNKAYQAIIVLDI